MKWNQAKLDILRLYWRNESDKELGLRLGVTARSVEHKRLGLGLDRRGARWCTDYFVVQVTCWLEAQQDTEVACELLQNGDIEHIVVKSDEGYAVFRPRVGVAPISPAPPQSAWVVCWEPE